MSTDSPWVYYADRGPTKEDGDAGGLVLSRYAFGAIVIRTWESTDYVKGQCWMRIPDLPPLPKRKVWREPTQADLDVATEPIPCMVWGVDDVRKIPRTLIAISKFSQSSCRFVANAGRWEHCEIEVEE